MDDAKVLLLVGAYIRNLRKAAGMRQRDLADRVGLTRASISNIEAGRQDVPVTRLVAISAALGVAPAAHFEPLDRLASEVARLTDENRRLRQVFANARAALGAPDA